MFFSSCHVLLMIKTIPIWGLGFCIPLRSNTRKIIDTYVLINKNGRLVWMKIVFSLNRNILIQTFLYFPENFVWENKLTFLMTNRLCICVL